MATNYIQEGDTITYTNAGAAITSDAVVIVGNRQCSVALVNISATTGSGSVMTEGVFELPKNTSDAVVQGQKLWWDATAGEVINAPAINAYFIGYAIGAELAAATTVEVSLAPFADEGPRVLTLAATGAQTLNVGDFGGGELIVFAPNTAAQTVNLPSVADIPPGSKLFVKKTDATAQAVTLDPASSETIAGGATFATIDANNDLAQFVSTGAAWVLMHSTIV
jgi:predicted RecA/RadA family phage recombinase